MDHSPRKRCLSCNDPTTFPSKRARANLDATAETRRPLVVCAAPNHQSLFDQLPVGTLFELARIARSANIDLSNVPRQNLNRLLGSNNVGIRQICDVLGTSSMQVMDEKCAQALDYEAKCIVEGNGHMLECDPTLPQPRPRSGTVLFGATLNICEVVGASPPGEGFSQRDSQPDPNCLTLRLPRVSQSCLFTRTFGSHRFLRVSLLDRARYCRAQMQSQKLYLHALRPIEILGRMYRPLIEKDDTVWYYLTGADHVGREAEKQGRARPGEYGLGNYIPSVTELVEWWIPMHSNRDQLACKLVTRLHLGISNTSAGPILPNECIQLHEDIVRGKYTFTDGAGMISEQLSAELWAACTVRSITPPSAYQIRIGTSKGVVQVATRREPAIDRGRWIALTRSMLKAVHDGRSLRPGPIMLSTYGVHILDAAHFVTSIVKPSSCRIPARLNAQIIPILCEQGVPETVIWEFQAQTIASRLEALLTPSKAFLDLQPNARLKLAKSIQTQACLIFKAMTVDPMLERIARSHSSSSLLSEDFAFEELLATTAERNSEFSYANLIQTRNEQLYMAIMSDFNVMSSTYFVDIWKKLIKDAAYSVIADHHIVVESSALVTIVPDFTEQLPEGYISFAPLEPVLDSKGSYVSFTSGSVLVGRNPALLCTDIQKVRLANIPVLQERRGVVFFSTKGKRPLADVLAGGDYDGDEVLLIWDQNLVQPFNNALFPDEEVLMDEAYGNFERDPIKAGQLHDQLMSLPKDERERLLEEHLLSSLKEPLRLGIYYGYYLKAVHQRGLASHQARLLAHKFNILMDSPRTAWRLKPDSRKKDESDWGPWSKPEWKHQQDIFRRRINLVNDGLKFNAAVPNVLDNLYRHGMQEFERQCEVMNLKSMDACYDHIQRERLLMPWKRAEEWAKGDQAKEAELELIKQTVIGFRNDFNRIWASKNLRRQQEDLMDLSRRFESEPPPSALPLFSSPYPDAIHEVKASYAYILDTEWNKLGKIGGFPWRMACPILLGLVQKKSVHLPYQTFQKLTPHYSFCR